MINDITVRQQKNMLRRETAAWQSAAIGLLALSMFTNTVFGGLYASQRKNWESESDQLRQELRQAENIRDLAVRELGAMSLRQARERLTREAQTAAYEAVAGYRYVGTCTVTYYCPCEECCGRWADGVTATDLPAGPGIVAVDPEVIALGSTVIIDGQKYLAADTGVTGDHVDICVIDHTAAEMFGVQTAEVWIISE